MRRVNTAAYDLGYAIGQALFIVFPILVVVGIVVAVRQSKRRRVELEQQRRDEDAARAQAQWQAQQWAAAQHAQVVAQQQWEAERARQDAMTRAALAQQERAEQEARARAKTERMQRLTARFGTEAAARIAAGEIWRGASEEMLLEVLGQPLDVDTKVTKTRSVRTLKYRARGKNRYGLRVTVENGVVVGWDEKD